MARNKKRKRPNPPIPVPSTPGESNSDSHSNEASDSEDSVDVTVSAEGTPSIQFLHEFRNNAEYSDLKITSGATSWFAHRVIESLTHVVDLSTESPAILDSILAYFYTQTYKTASSKPIDVLEHASRVYAAAEFFGAQGLKRYCLTKVFKLLRDWKLEENGFFHCAKLAWTTTPESDAALRNLYVEYLRRVRHRGSNMEGFVEKLKGVDGLAADVLAVEWA